MLRNSFTLRVGLAEGLDALGTQHLVHRAAVLHDKRLLQVRFELAVCSTLGERAVVTEGGGLTTVCALSHVLEASFLAIIPVPVPFRRAGHFTIHPFLSQGERSMET